MKATTVLAFARAGSARARRRAFFAAMSARRLALTAAGLQTGVLDALAHEPVPSEELAGHLEFTDHGTLDGFLAVLAADGLIRGNRNGWRLTRLGSGLVEDGTARAMIEAFDSYHTALYRELTVQLRGGPRRTDVTDSADLMARLTRVFEPWICDELTKVLSEVRPNRVLDIGCGSGALLAHMLVSAPEARGVGIDLTAVNVAARTCAEAGVSARTDLALGDASALLWEGKLAGPGSIDVALAANVLYYLPTADLRELLASIAAVLRPGGVLVVVATELDDSVNSRHLDLLLRTQDSPMGLFPRQTMLEELESAGLRVGRVKRLAPGEPLVAVHAQRPVALGV